MTAISPEQTFIDNLIALKAQYEQALTETDAKAASYRDQLAHINALLLNQLISPSSMRPLQAQIEPVSPSLVLSPQVTPSKSAPDLTLSAEDFSEATVQSPPAQLRGQDNKASKAKPVATPSKNKRNSLTLLPAYEGLKKLEAIGQVLTQHRGAVLSMDDLIQSLYGTLSDAELKAERLRMKTALYQGVRNQLWEKADAPSSYLISVSKGKQGSKNGKGNRAAIATDELNASSSKPAVNEAISAAEPSVKKTRTQKSTKPSGRTKAQSANTLVARTSLPFVPAYAGMKKLDAIQAVLEKHKGDVLHHDTIIQTLYGDLSPADLKAERRRINTSLLNGVKRKKWQKAPAPSSYKV